MRSHFFTFLVFLSFLCPILAEEGILQQAHDQGEIEILNASKDRVFLSVDSLEAIEGDLLKFLKEDSKKRQYLLKITGGKPTRIRGHLPADGKLWILNPHGVIIDGKSGADASWLFQRDANKAPIGVLNP